MTGASDPILHTAAPVAGSMHDSTLFRINPPTSPHDLPAEMAAPGAGASGVSRTAAIRALIFNIRNATRVWPENENQARAPP